MDFDTVSYLQKLKRQLRKANEMNLHTGSMSPVQKQSVNELRDEVYTSAEILVDEILNKLTTTHIVRKK